MTDTRALTVSESDYGAIESAVMETARGRWFLAEYARRNRNADTDVLLQAIGRLENVVTQERTSHDFDRVRFDLLEMAKAISKTKSEVAALRPGEQAHSDLSVASEALDGIVRSTERATSEILEAAEHVQETAWTLREAGADDALCSELDRRATEIYTACTFQDLTAQRIVKIVNTLRFLEGRITAMIEIWGGDDDRATASGERPDLAADLAAHDGLSQSDVDVVIIDGSQEPAAPARPVFVDVQLASVKSAEAAFDDVTFEEAEVAEIAEVAATAGHADEAVAVEAPPRPEEEPRYAVTVFDDDLLFVDPGLGARQEQEAAARGPDEANDDDVAWGVDTAADAEGETKAATAEGLARPEALADIESWTTNEKLARFS